MLSKKACKACRGNFWDANDEDWWSRGHVTCLYIPKGYRNNLIDIDKPPPEKCKYWLEHFMENQGC